MKAGDTIEIPLDPFKRKEYETEVEVGELVNKVSEIGPMEEWLVRFPDSQYLFKRFICKN